MSRSLLALSMSLALTAGTASAASLCLGPSVANQRNISLTCAFPGQPLSQLYAGYGETTAEACAYDGCPNPGGDCGCGMTSPFQWSISRSATDPSDQVGPLSSNELYLWLEICGSNIDWIAAEFALTGTLGVARFEPTAMFQDTGTVPDLLLFPAEPQCLTQGQYLVGTIYLGSPVAVPGELQAGSWGRTKALYND